MLQFAHDIAGGQGNLIVTALKSPNFVHGSTGWAIGKDGSAEFHDIILPAGVTGAVVYFDSTEPASPNTGDLWYNTADGLALSQWDGTEWVPYSIGTGAIASGAVTPSLTAAGDTTNPNPWFSGGDTSSWSAYSGAVLDAAQTSGFSYPWAAQVTTPAAQAYPGISGLGYPVNPGDPVQVNGWVDCNADTALTVAYYDADFNYLSNTSFIFSANPGIYQYGAVVGIVPTGAANAAINVQFNTESTIGTEQFLATGLTVMTKVNGGLIEPNTVTADQIAAGIVIAGIVDATTISAATLEGGTIDGGTISGAEVEGGTFNGGTFSGGTIDGGTINAGTINGAVVNVNADGGIVVYNDADETIGTWNSDGLDTTSISINGVTGTASLECDSGHFADDVVISGTIGASNFSGSYEGGLSTVATVSAASTSTGWTSAEATFLTTYASAINGIISRLISAGLIV